MALPAGLTVTDCVADASAVGDSALAKVKR
jgi:hypothetical protein